MVTVTDKWGEIKLSDYLSVRTINALTNAGYTHLSELGNVPLVNLRKIGRVGVREIMYAIEAAKNKTLNPSRLNTNALVGAALDWAVAKASGIKIYSMAGDWPGNSVINETASTEPVVIINLIGELWLEYQGKTMHYAPSKTFEQCESLIKKFIFWFQMAGGKWRACCHNCNYEYGETPELAICRAVVAAKLGNNIEIPEELKL